MTGIPDDVMGDVWPGAEPGRAGADYGTVSFSPDGSFEARSFQTFSLVYTVGQYGLDDTGAIKVVHNFTPDGGKLQFDDPGAANYVTATASNGARLHLYWEPYGHQRPWNKSLRISVEGGYMSQGDTITIIYGDRSGGSPGYRLQTFCESAFVFKVLVDACATGQFLALPASPSISIVAGKPHLWKAILPTLRQPGEVFSLGLKAEDLWGNPTGEHTGKLRLEASQPIAGLPGTIDFPAGERAFTIAGLHIGNECTAAVLVYDEAGNQLAKSNPLVIRTGPVSAFWGDLHGQSGETVGINPIREYFEFARDLAFLDVTSHQANDFQIKNHFWAEINAVSREFEVDGHFIVFPGYEWSGNTPVGGDHNVFFRHENRQIRRSSHALLTDRSDIETDAATSKDLFAALKGEDCVVYAHVGGRPADISFAHDPVLRTAVEVHSDWGTFEWIMTDSFELGYRLGLVCNSDGHKGRPGASYPGASQFGAFGGLTCFLTSELSRDAIFECQRRRHHYGTTGCRMHLDVRARFAGKARLYTRDPRYHDVDPVEVDEIMMGDIAQTGDDAVELTIEAIAHTPIERIDVLNGADLVETVSGHGEADLGNRIRVIWQGAEYRGRGRQTSWRGRAEFSGARIARIAKINVWNHEHPVELDGGNAVTFDTITTGNFGGFDAWLDDGANGTLNIETGHVSASIDLSEIGLADHVLDAGGLDRKIRIYRLPETQHRSSITATVKVPLRPRGDNQIWLRVTTEDGYNAWSSPMFIYR
ncbi:MAG: DUF3604 domain-containing protein [Rhizobiales bacterium]|nr:DUF3604 domain-containing protein [Hyphomicrobiales bacterium]